MAGRKLGMDFDLKDGYRMYHGHRVPGFPVHPHRGFETVTIALDGFIDHADSLGAKGRYGSGDVQWMTAGQGIQHSEMFPLLDGTAGNKVELFQIWMNLSPQAKMVKPHFTMFWRDQIPELLTPDQKVSIRVIAGTIGGVTPLAPPPDSWAHDQGHAVGIWLVSMQAGSSYKLPGEPLPGVQRVIYAYAGSELHLNGQRIEANHGVAVVASETLKLEAKGELKLLALQGLPIGEPVAQQGPFVMNTQAELVQAFQDFRATSFGGWPWPRPDPSHGPQGERFAVFPDGRRETPSSGPKPRK